MLKRITMENMKGTTAIQELTGRDIILGRNGAGKTTRMQSIGLAMNGYVPGKGKTAADTFKMASDETMTVGLETDSFEMSRTFKRNSKLNKKGETEVKISQALFISPSAGETTNAQKEQRIKNELGDFPVMMDFGSFIGMTDNQKRDFIYSLSGSQTVWNKDRIAKELREGAGVDDTINEKFADVCEQNIEFTMTQYKDGIDVQAGLLAMSEYAKEKLKYWKKEKSNSDGAARKLTELKNRGQQTDRDLAENEQKLKELEHRKETITKDISDASAQNNIHISKQRELESIIKEIETLSEVPNAERIRELEEGIEALEKSIAQADEKRFEDEEKAIIDKSAELKRIKKEVDQEMNDATNRVATINAEIKSNTDLLKRIESMNGCCAFSPNLPCNQDFSEFIQKTNDILDDYYEAQEETEELLNLLKKKQQDIEAEIEENECKKRENQEELKRYRKAIYESIQELNERKAELSTINGREPELASKKELKAVIEAEIEKNPQVDLTAMNEEKNLVSGQIEALRSTVDEQKKFKNDLINIKANIIDSQTAEFQVLSWKNIVDTLGQNGIKGKMVKEMLDPMKDDIDHKIKDIGIYQEMYFQTESDTGKEVFTFGFEDMESKMRRPFDALSTGEQLIFLITLMTTIIDRANPPVKLLAIDNINDLDSNNLKLILHGLNKAGSTMDNIILSGVAEPEEEDTEGWKVWRL